MAGAPTPAPSSRTASIVVGVTIPLVWLGAAVVSVPVVMMSVMLFDAPGSTESPYTIGMFASIASFPVLAVISGLATAVAAFLAKRAPDAARYRRRFRVAIGLALLPLLSGVALAVFIVLTTVLCGGELRC